MIAGASVVGTIAPVGTLQIDIHGVGGWEIHLPAAQ
jgi:hypothetical protein